MYTHSAFFVLNMLFFIFRYVHLITLYWAIFVSACTDNHEEISLPAARSLTSGQSQELSSRHLFSESWCGVIRVTTRGLQSVNPSNAQNSCHKPAPHFFALFRCHTSIRADCIFTKSTTCLIHLWHLSLLIWLYIINLALCTFWYYQIYQIRMLLYLNIKKIWLIADMERFTSLSASH